jgi:hypothetical protein
MTGYTGRPAKWEPTDSYIYFDVPGGCSGRIHVPARDEASAMAIFYSKWAQIAEVATARCQRGELENGEVVLDILMFQ